MVNTKLIKLIIQERGDRELLDLGTGDGEVALSVAPFFSRVVGIDIDDEAIHRARERSRRLGISNAYFYVADAYTTCYREFGRFEVISAGYFMDRVIVEKSGEALPSGGAFVFVCLHTDNLRELNYKKRFVFSEEEIRGYLERYGFEVEYLEVERHIVKINRDTLKMRGSSEKMRALKEYIDSGDSTLTFAYIIGKGRKL